MIRVQMSSSWEQYNLIWCGVIDLFCSKSFKLVFKADFISINLLAIFFGGKKQKVTQYWLADYFFW